MIKNLYLHTKVLLFFICLISIMAAINDPEINNSVIKILYNFKSKEEFERWENDN